jgi:hypothetical protein
MLYVLGTETSKSLGVKIGDEAGAAIKIRPLVKPFAWLLPNYIHTVIRTHA